MSVYYNDSEPFVCAWLRNLIRAGLIPAGEVDERPIQEVTPDDVRGFTQCHFFAGIGGWAYGLLVGGWPAERPVWTGSCPCQDLSAAGQQRGAEGTRHLWPEWYRLIAECRPPTVFGEQVASKLGRYWLTAVRLDLEALGFAVGAADLCAAGVGAPHIRQRLYFVADSDGSRRGARGTGEAGDGSNAARLEPSRLRAAGVLGVPSLTGLEGHVGHGDDGHQPGRLRTESDGSVAAAGPTRELADTDGGEPSDGDVQRGGQHGLGPQDGGAGFWDAVEWLPCRDGKARPVEPGTFPLAHGIPARVGRLRAYGNAIVPQVAAAFVSAYLACAASTAERESR